MHDGKHIICPTGDKQQGNIMGYGQNGDKAKRRQPTVF